LVSLRFYIYDLFIFRIWDVTSGEEIHKFEFPSIPNSIEVSKDGTILVISYGHFTSFWNAER